MWFLGRKDFNIINRDKGVLIIRQKKKKNGVRIKSWKVFVLSKTLGKLSFAFTTKSLTEINRVILLMISRSLCLISIKKKNHYQ